MFGPKFFTRLGTDGKVYTNEVNNITQLANLINYKIRTEGELANKQAQAANLGVTTVVDLGKQLLQYTRDSDIKGVKSMLKRGAPFTSDWLGMSALHFAAMNNQYEICEDLLKSGINKDSKTKVDRTPLHLACFYGNERIVELLLSKKCVVNPRDMLRMTPLHWAVEKGHKNIVRMLLQHNADVTVVSKFGKTPIALAVMTEQADVLAELESARQAHANKKYNEAHEAQQTTVQKETSEAVNSIMGLTATSIIDDSESIRKSNLDADHDVEYAEVKIADLDSVKETGILDNSTINLLKSHGISMQDDDDTSKDLLATALRNGRQLVLSEGGKLLLNETSKLSQNTIISNNNSSGSKIMPVRLKNSNIAGLTQLPANKGRANTISKAKDSLAGNRNKNIRIISLNDFKKLYGNTNIKSMQKLPSSLARQISAEDMQIDNAERKMFVNMRNRGALGNIVDAEDLIEEDEIMPGIIQMSLPTDSETEASDIDQQHSKILNAAGTALTTTPSTSSGNKSAGTSTATAASATPVRMARRVEHMGSVQVRHLPTRQQLLNANNKSTNMANSNSSTSTASSANAYSVMPLLSTTEICRQLLELRRQNDELRRKFEIAQKEKEDLRLRVERLEEMYLIEKAEEDYIA